MKPSVIPRAARGGFVLVTVLALLATAGTILAGIACYSCRVAFHALAAQQSLQRKWALFSLQRTLLQQPETFLDAAPPDSPDSRVSRPGPRHPVRLWRSRFSGEIRLGGVRCRFVLSDENAKVNVNQVYDRLGRERTRRLLRRLVPATGGLTMRLRPARPPARNAARPAFDSWGQVFALERLPGRTASGEAVQRSTEWVTCWGRGQLNVRRVPDTVFQQLLRMIVSERTVRRLMERRNRNPSVTAEELLRNVPAEEQADLRDLLTDRSSCYSLWVTLRGPSRRQDVLWVREADEWSGTRTFGYAW